MLTIEFPSEVALAGSRVPSCTYTINGVPTTSTAIQTTSINPVKVKITDAFTSAAYTNIGIPFNIACSGLRNPRTTAETSSFQIYTFDSIGNPIEMGITDITAKMTIAPDMTSFTATPSIFINGEVTTYTIDAVSVIPHITNDKMIFTFPTEISLTSVSCTIGTSVTTVLCSKSGNTLTAILGFGAGITPNTPFQFNVIGVKNPPDTRKSSSFTNIIM